MSTRRTFLKQLAGTTGVAITPVALTASQAPAAPAGPPSPSDSAIAAAYEDARLTILKQLERGEIDVTEAGRRLEALDAADIPEEPSRG